MSRISFGYVRTTVSTAADTEYESNRALARRKEDLDDYAVAGYTLLSTISITAEGRRRTRHTAARGPWLTPQDRWLARHSAVPTPGFRAAMRS